MKSRLFKGGVVLLFAATAVVVMLATRTPVSQADIRPTTPEFTELLARRGFSFTVPSTIDIAQVEATGIAPEEATAVAREFGASDAVYLGTLSKTTRTQGQEPAFELVGRLAYALSVPDVPTIIGGPFRRDDTGGSNVVGPADMVVFVDAMNGQLILATTL